MRISSLAARVGLVAAPALMMVLTALGAHASETVAAKRLFGRQPLPAALEPQVHGFYTKGCVAGAVAIATDGPHWQAMRLSRNRRWGHPDLVRIIEELSVKAAADGWNGLLVGDMSQPRGGPMLTGHRSHQVGLDADLWFTPMPDRRLTYHERENISAVSVLRKGSFYVDEARWNHSFTMLMKHAAGFAEVERVLVHPGVKKKLCDTVEGDRAWLRKIRPFWGHHYHFHIRIGCPAGSPDCRRQDATPAGEGCGDSLTWWFVEGLVPKKPKVPAKPTKPRIVTLADLPAACSAVLEAKARPEAEATVSVTGFVAPELDVPAFDPAAVIAGKPIEAGGANLAAQLPENVAVPTPRPAD